MSKRKYTRFGEEPQAYQCTNAKCKWVGTDKEKIEVENKDGWTELGCGNCGKTEFFGLLVNPNTQENVTS